MKRRIRIVAIILALACIMSVVTVMVSAATAASGNRAATPAPEEVINAALVMKVNSDNALKNGEKITLFTDGNGNSYGGPYKNSDGSVMVPLVPVLTYAGATYTVSGSNVTVSGKTFPIVTKAFGSASVIYVALDQVEAIVPGYYVTYDESGLIYISLYDDFINRSDDESLMIESAKEFIFYGIDFRSIVGSNGKSILTVESKKNDTLTNLMKSYTIKNNINAFYNSKGGELKSLYNMFAENTNNFTHPYIKTNQAKFDELHTNYTATSDYDEELRWYIETQIAYADTYLTQYANFDANGNYVGLKEGQWSYDSEGKANPGSGWDTSKTEGNHSVSQMPYENSGYGKGYDPAGGRLNVLSDGETCLVGALEPAALAYQITRDEKYLAFAYEWMTALCEWEHWGPGHFLNVANTARPLATAYDWLYNDIKRVYGQTAVNNLAKRIYENSVYEAILTLNGYVPEHERSGDSSKYWAHVGNWNSCGTVGMLIASLAVLGNEGYGTEYMEECLYVIAASLAHYEERGLTYVTLDGGYRESAGYWGAVRFMHTIHKVLVDTAGADFGLLDYPGIDTADYFGCMLEGPSYQRWNYHDDWVGTQPSFWYYLTADMFDNPEYAAIRYEQMHSGNKNKEPHRFDVLYYNKEMVDNRGESNLKLDYSMTSIDATIVRDSWAKNSLFAGIMGGYNNVAHGQYDSGNWIYENKGIRWFVDLGADNYNLYGGGFSKGYYKYSAEGNNTLAMGSLPHGQVMDSTMNADTMGGQLISFKNNEYGSATIIDQKTVYNGTATDDLAEKVEYAYRGMLLTNSRNTFVIQDEVKTKSPETLYWFAHYNNKSILKIEISDDGRTVYMWASNADGDFQKLRVTLVSDNKNLKFEIMDTYTLLLEGTPDPDYSPTNKPGIKENDRTSYSKLAVKAENVTELNMAVVIEVVNGMDQPALGYDTLVPMDEWQVEEGSDDEYGDDNPVYTVYYSDGSSEDYYTSRLAEGLLRNPDDPASATSGSTNTKSGVVRIECYDNVTVDANLNLDFNVHWTINLNGNLLYQTRTIRDGISTTNANTNGGITVNNGMWYSTTHFQLRIGTTLILNNVDYYSTAFSIRDEGAKIVIKDSTITTNTHLVHMVNAASTTESSDHNLIISNSEIKLGTNLVVYAEGNQTNKNYHNVYILDNTKIEMPEYVANEENPITESEFFANNLVRYIVDANGKQSVDVTTNFIIEDGVKLNYPGFTIPADEITDTLNHKYTLAYCTGATVGNGGELSKGTPLYSAVDGVYGYDGYLITVSNTGDPDYPYVIDKNTAVNFEAYLENGKVIYYYTNELSAALPTNNADNGVRTILLYADAILSKEAKLGNSQQLVIDLNGRTLKITNRITMGSSVASPISCKVTVKNGTLNKTGGDGFCARMGTTLIFKDLTITSTTKLLWDNGASNIIFDSCTVNATGNLVYARVFFKENIDIPRNLYVIDTNMDISGSLFFYSECTAEKDERDFVLMGNSRISYANVLTYDSNLPANIGISDYRFHIEKGALVSKSGFGLPESTETLKLTAIGYDYIDIDSGYEITASRMYPTASFVEKDGYYTVEFKTAVVGVKGSLTLYSDFTVNFFLPVEGNLIERVVANGVEYIISETEIYVDSNGVSYYKIMVENVAPNSAASSFEILFYYGNAYETKTFSVLEYCELLLGDKRYETSHTLAASVVDYVNAAYEYSSTSKPEILTNLLVSLGYRKARPEAMPVDISSTDKGTAGVAVHGIQLDLSGSLYFRVNLMPDFTGTLTINSVSYDVVNGVCDGKSYINIGVRAFDMYNPSKFVSMSGITADGKRFAGTYDLRAYINNTDKNDITLANLLSALYTYCTEAYSYKYGVIVERPDIGSTPSVDVDFFG